MNNSSPQRMQEHLLAVALRPATYEAPAVIFEVALEVRAGSPLGLPDPLDWLGTNQARGPRPGALLISEVALELKQTT
jgi:hypothetical protein